MRNWIIYSGFLWFLVSVCSQAGIPTSPRAEQAMSRVKQKLQAELSQQQLAFAKPVYIRIFKQPAILEVWVERADGRFKRFKQYDICSYSGELGPKLKEGDKQSPEGFYFITPDSLNPNSRFYLSFNLGFPNIYDRYHSRTGSALMVHGNCVSIGCYAMTDPQIAEIYTLVAAAFAAGQPFIRVHAFPFRLEADRLANYSSHPWYNFWKNLKQGYDYFNQFQRPPNTEVRQGRYVFD